MEEWRKGLKNKPFNYWIRDEMEAIIKEKNINRNLLDKRFVKNPVKSILLEVVRSG